MNRFSGGGGLCYCHVKVIKDDFQVQCYCHAYYNWKDLQLESLTLTWQANINDYFRECEWY